MWKTDTWAHPVKTICTVFKDETPRGSVSFFPEEQEDLKKFREFFTALNPVEPKPVVTTR